MPTQSEKLCGESQIVMPLSVVVPPAMAGTAPANSNAISNASSLEILLFIFIPPAIFRPLERLA